MMLFIKRKTSTEKQVAGDSAEALALAHLQAQGLTLVQRNYRAGGVAAGMAAGVAAGVAGMGSKPGKQRGEIDLIMRDGATLVFVEVRSRQSAAFGSAAASVTTAKQRKIVLAAQHFLQRAGASSQRLACRFDVVALQGAELQWLKGAFHA
jgi:putative endonuclease